MSFEPTDISRVFSPAPSATQTGGPAAPLQFVADVPGRLSYAELLARLLPKDRLNVERHVAMCDLNLGPAHTALWQRLACHMLTLCDSTAKTVGRHTMQFFVPDGRYRLQVFALHDQHNGHLLVYAYNVLEEAFAQDLLERPTAADSVTYRVRDTRDLLTIEQLDAKSTTPAPYYKEMLGWNRRALRISLPTDATEIQLNAVETLCTLSKSKWPS